jgi:4-hydroxy-4-methyl-2-oxoglutarate aldolase
MKAVGDNILRPDIDTLKSFYEFESALLHEAMGKQGALTSDFRPIYPGARVVGSALTVQAYPRDNLMLHKAISIAHPGDVIVAVVGGYTEGGHWGEIAATAALQRGIRGLVIDGGVRDVDAVAKLDFPVFARSISMKGTSKIHGGLINQVIEIGGISVSPGDIVVGDTDGVMVIPLEECATVMKNAALIRKKEEGLLRGIREGELTIDLLNLRDVLRGLDLD